VPEGALGETINIMNGWADWPLARGHPGDDATVEIENINRNLAMGKETVQAMFGRRAQIADRRSFRAVHLHCVPAHVLSFGRGRNILFVPLPKRLIFRDAWLPYIVSRQQLCRRWRCIFERGRRVSGRPARGEKMEFFRAINSRLSTL